MLNQTVTLYPGNSQVVRLDGLYRPADDVFPTTATVTATLTDANGDAVAGLDNLALTYIEGTPSSYEALVDPTQFNPLPGEYTLNVVALAEASGPLSLRIPATVRPRHG